MDIQESIDDISKMKTTHIEWAEYFEAHPDIEKGYIASGEWDTAEEHRNIIKQYDKVLCILNSLKEKTKVPFFDIDKLSVKKNDVLVLRIDSVDLDVVSDFLGEMEEFSNAIEKSWGFKVPIILMSKNETLETVYKSYQIQF